MKEFTNELLGIFTDLAKVIRSLVGSRTTWVMLVGFTAVWLSSGKVEALQQLLAYLGLGSIWVIKMATQNVASIIKNGGVKPSVPQAPEIIEVTRVSEKTVEFPRVISPVPFPDTTPPFTVADNVLVEAQKQAIAVWYTKSVTSPPEIPNIPKPEATLYTDIVLRDGARRLELENNLIEQMLKVFLENEVTKVIKLRKDCDVRIWHQVNDHWRKARNRWMDYGRALWEYSEL